MTHAIKCCKCNEKPVFRKKHQLCSRCYASWWNRNGRDKQGAREYMGAYARKHPEIVMLSRFKSKAKSESLPFNLDLEWFRSRIEQNTCEVTGLEFEWLQYEGGRKGRRSLFSPSVDRIDNSRGYTKDNCRMVVWGVNLLKNNQNEEDALIVATSWVNNVARQKENRSALI